MSKKYTLDLKEVKLIDLQLVGGKNASLGEMIQNIGDFGVNIPGGFAITVEAYDEFLKFNKLDQAIRLLMDNLVKDDLVSLRKTGLEIRKLIRNGEWPKNLKEQIKTSYFKLANL